MTDDKYKELEAENAKLKDLAYHKQGLSYKAMFTYSMDEAPLEVERLKAEIAKRDRAIEVMLEHLDWIRRVNACDYEYMAKAVNALTEVYRILNNA